MFLPFRRELNDVFTSDRSTWSKMGGCAFATTFVVMIGTLRFLRENPVNPPPSVPRLVGLAVASAVLGALLGLALSLHDVVRRRVVRGQPVNPILKLYFGSGGWSLVAWFPTVIVLALVITIVSVS